jgi:5-methylcytosine-specific restriction endonuclease McrA
MKQKISKEIMDETVVQVTSNFTKILSTNEIKNSHPELYWGGNGVGDRWASKKFNYSVIYAKKQPSLYSENDDDKIPTDLLNEFLQTNKGVGIIGIFVHSRRTNIETRPIYKNIHKKITSLSCVICGTHDTICDHKNDLYNDERVLNTNTQLISDFQPLCNHCNLQKRQICKIEEQTQKIYSAKNIQRYQFYPFEFPWEKKVFDRNDIYCKNGTYWFDPVEFDKNIHYYSRGFIV